MQDTLRLMIFTIVGVAILWFVTMAVNVHLFKHTDADPVVFGFIPMNRTDIGNQCGDEYQNSAELVDYKLNTENQIVYLCPLGIWPIRSSVTAVTISDQFKNSLPPIQFAKVNALFPSAAGAQTPQSPSPVMQNNPPPISQQPEASPDMSNSTNAAQPSDAPVALHRQVITPSAPPQSAPQQQGMPAAPQQQNMQPMPQQPGVQPAPATNP